MNVQQLVTFITVSVLTLIPVNINPIKLAEIKEMDRWFFQLKKRNLVLRKSKDRGSPSDVLLHLDAPNVVS
jgi:hypothetical protein